jgi:hypothetical protein
MGDRRTTLLAGVAVAGGVLVPVGVALTALGSTRHHDALTVGGILALVLGLACLRVLFWVRRARLLTEIGLRFHRDEPGDAPGDGPA